MAKDRLATATALGGPDGGTPPRLARGTPLTEADLRAGRVLTVEAAAGARYAWDLGVALGAYLAGLREGRILGRECERCGRVLVPPRLFCELCFVPTARWVPVADTGTVQTLAICRIAWDARRLATPELPAVIALDGAAPGVGILHLLGEVAPERATVGLRVRAVWRPPAERTGSITDIRWFRPLADGEA